MPYRGYAPRDFSMGHADFFKTEWQTKGLKISVPDIYK